VKRRRYKTAPQFEACVYVRLWVISVDETDIDHSMTARGRICVGLPKGERPLAATVRIRSIPMTRAVHNHFIIARQMHTGPLNAIATADPPEKHSMIPVLRLSTFIIPPHTLLHNQLV